MLQTLQKTAALSFRIKGYITISIGIIMFFAGPIIALITKQYLLFFISLIGILTIFGGWYYLRRANWIESGGIGAVI